MKTPIYYGGQSWIALGWSEKLGQCVGVRFASADLLTIDTWSPENSHRRQALKDCVTTHGNKAVMDQFANLITL